MRRLHRGGKKQRIPTSYAPIYLGADGSGETILLELDQEALGAALTELLK